jgi:hypothetical protein
MSETKETVEVFLNWVKDGGLAGWIESVMDDEEKLKRIADIYGDLKEAFGF